MSVPTRCEEQIMLCTKSVVLYEDDEVGVIDMNAPDSPHWSELFPGCRQLTIQWTSIADPSWTTPRKLCVGFSLKNPASLGFSGEVRVTDLIDRIARHPSRPLDEWHYWKLFWLAFGLMVYIPPELG